MNWLKEWYHVNTSSASTRWEICRITLLDTLFEPFSQVFDLWSVLLVAWLCSTWFIYRRSTPVMSNIFLYSELQCVGTSAYNVVDNAHPFKFRWHFYFDFTMTSSNGNIFPRYWSFVRGIHRNLRIPLTKASDAELWCFLWSTLEQTIE